MTTIDEIEKILNDLNKQIQEKIELDKHIVNTMLLNSYIVEHYKICPLPMFTNKGIKLIEDNVLDKNMIIALYNDGHYETINVTYE